MIKKIFFFGLSMALFLQSFSAENSPVRSSFEIHEVGQINECPVYQLVLENQRNSEFQIVLKDKDGTILHDEFVSGKHIVRNYMLDLSDLGNTEVYAEIYDRFGMSIQKLKMKNK
jgi:hypothetical protein